MKRFLAYWLPPLLLSLAIIVAASDTLGGSNTEDWIRTLTGPLGLGDAALDIANRVVRKLGHLTTYGALGALWFRAIRGGRAGWNRRWAALALMLTVVVASADETKQSFTATRTGTPADVGIDAVGASVALAVIRWRSGKRSV